MKRQLSRSRAISMSILQTTLFLLTLGTRMIPSSAQRNTKRGIAYLGNTHKSDNSLLLSSSSPLSWYYNWSPYPATEQIPLDSPLEFTPLVHGIDDAESSQTQHQIKSLPRSSMHILTFNEPDGDKDSGGSDIDPEDAARAYIEHIVPYHTSNSRGGRTWNISHPSVTRSPRGLDWLRQFNLSCYKIDEENGCPTDFIAAHWYGAFDGLASWLGTLDEFYNANRSDDTARLKIWITEMALPQANTHDTVNMMNQTLPYLEKLEYVEKYAWFGAFRTDDANEWTGDGVALFDDDGGLTKLGALYMGGEVNGFEEGDKGNAGTANLVKVNAGLLWVLAMFTMFVSSFW
ncbi:glycoside hydrolase family 128 protein [Zopfia rhizophila CBS 207.26]|uniref:Glycoside hydrolase family 128 protein n=1 Tax=Zopfia rhizophila CBS 207.26 TaxID=1314779 RepID=A0A6A6EU30_9PEZI|nr:glycoside hydrolase family 128 protein [Zopfia rhizophila CBS 207.26]